MRTYFRSSSLYALVALSVTPCNAPLLITLSYAIFFDFKYSNRARHTSNALHDTWMHFNCTVGLSLLLRVLIYWYTWSHHLSFNYIDYYREHRIWYEITYCVTRNFSLFYSYCILLVLYALVVRFWCLNSRWFLLFLNCFYNRCEYTVIG